MLALAMMHDDPADVAAESLVDRLPHQESLPEGAVIMLLEADAFAQTGFGTDERAVQTTQGLVRDATTQTPSASAASDERLQPGIQSQELGGFLASVLPRCVRAPRR